MKYPKLFEPIGIGGVVYRNRIVSAPQGNYNNRAAELPSAENIAFYGRKAKGGFASVTVGDCIVDSEKGIHFPFLIKTEEANSRPGLSAIASVINRNGAVASAELNHAGQRAEYVFEQRGYGYGPSDDSGWKLGEVKGMTESEIYKVIEDFGKAAAWVKECGFRMITIHGGHGWLLTQFMSPYINKRRDAWGGSHENRMRLPIAVIEEIRKRVGKRVPIEIRISGDERDSGGYDIDYGIRIAKSLEEKVDIIHVSAGIHDYERASYYTHPTMFLPDGVNSELAARIKREVKCYVATVGAFTEAAMMEEIIASGRADFVAVGRQSLADPDFPKKARAGMDEAINKCMRCLACFSSIGKHRYPQCAVNPEISHEIEAAGVRSAERKKKIVVAGGGIAGMQAALRASERGHEVILCEKGSELGGVLRCEKEVPFKKRLHEYIERQSERVKKSAIELRMNTEANAALIEAEKPEVVIAAIGAAGIKPNIPGIDRSRVFSAEEVYADSGKAEGHVVIIGGGLSGIELAIYLSGIGRTAEILEANANPPDNGPQGEVLKYKMDDLGIQVHYAETVHEITQSHVKASRDYEYGTVVYAVGTEARRTEAFRLLAGVDEAYMIGDCVEQGSIMNANLEGWTIGNNV